MIGQFSKCHIEDEYRQIFPATLLKLVNNKIDLPYFACILRTNIAVYPAINAIKSPIKIDDISPDCLIAQGTDNNDVPIMVFHIAKLN